MRELKFRAYDSLKKKWLMGYKPCGGFSLIGESMACNEWARVLCDMVRGEFGETGEHLIIQQYTGLKDKNGTDIYEGDILRGNEWVFNPKTEESKIYRENAIGHIWYANPCSYIAEWAVSFNHLYSECSCKFTNLRDAEVIGNINENPELLNNV